MKISTTASLCLFFGHMIVVIGAVMIVLDRRGRRPQIGRVGGAVLGCGAVASIVFDLLGLFLRFVE